MKTMREKFEELPEIEQGLRHCQFNESTNDYHADVSHEETHEWHMQFVNGAWYAFQEQQKKIDAIVQLAYYETDDYDLDLKIQELLNESRPK